MTHKEVLNLPKIELHCHLDGSISQECLEFLLGRNISSQELEVSNDCDSLKTYLEKFKLPIAAIQTPDGLRAATFDLLRQASNENVRYIEIRFAPLLSVNKRFTADQVLDAVIEGIQEGYRRFGIRSQIIVCLMRHHSLSDNFSLLYLVKRYLGKGVCAIDLAGDEAAYPMNKFKDVFYEAKRMGIPFTIHAGECGSLENVIEAVQCGAQRIGHGIALRGHQEEINFCKERGIGIEMCPISNLQTKAVRSKAEYPLREFLDNGLLATINTDNRTVSNTRITKELLWIQSEYGITDQELIQLQKNAIEVSFASETLKEELRQLFATHP